MPILAAPREQQIAAMEKRGAIVPGCKSCQEFYQAADPSRVWAPQHAAMPSCLSGKHPHCTCDTCF